jgi:hypothetical protein
VWEDVKGFISLVYQWMFMFYKNIEQTSEQVLSSQTKSECPDLFGSIVIDLLESIPDCKKDVTVNIDSGGWCYIKGEYKLHLKFWMLLPGCANELEPLTFK